MPCNHYAWWGVGDTLSRHCFNVIDGLQLFSLIFLYQFCVSCPLYMRGVFLSFLLIHLLSLNKPILCPPTFLISEMHIFSLSLSHLSTNHYQLCRCLQRISVVTLIFCIDSCFLSHLFLLWNLCFIFRKISLGLIYSFSSLFRKLRQLTCYFSPNTSMYIAI